MKKFSIPLARRYALFFSLAAWWIMSAFQEQQQTGGIPPWVWILLIGILVLLIAWWIFRASQRSTMMPERMESSPPPATTAPDDLTVIEGIGPKIAGILQSAGITTFNQLADTDVHHLRSILDEGGIRLADPRSWAEQARLAAAGDQAGLRALQDRLTAGRES